MITLKLNNYSDYEIAKLLLLLTEAQVTLFNADCSQTCCEKCHSKNICHDLHKTLIYLNRTARNI